VGIRIEHTGIGELIEDILDADQTPCSLCAAACRACCTGSRMRSGANENWPSVNQRTTSSKTLLLNYSSAGRCPSDAAKLVVGQGKHDSSFGALVYVAKTKAARNTKEREAFRSLAAAVPPVGRTWACSRQRSSVS